MVGAVCAYRFTSQIKTITVKMIVFIALLRKTDLIHSHPTGFERKGWSFLFAPATRQG
jgi:hypothetical protein